MVDIADIDRVLITSINSFGGIIKASMGQINNISVPVQQTGGIDGYTTIMLHMNGADGGTVFTDSSTNNLTVTASSNVTTKINQKKFGTASAYFGASWTSYVKYKSTTAFNLGSGDFTIDFWVRFSNGLMSPFNAFFCITDASNDDNATNWNVYCDYYTNRFRFSTYGGYQNNYTYAVNTTDWYHVACVRTGNTFKLAINGVFGGTSDTRTGTVAAGTSQNLILGLYTPYTQNGCMGNIDEFRISKGIARWTSDFTPPTQEYTVPS